MLRSFLFTGILACICGFSRCDSLSASSDFAEVSSDTLLVYVQRRSTDQVQHAVYVQSLVTRDTTKKLILEGSQAQSAISPLWSPTGKRIAFIFDVPLDSTRICEGCTHNSNSTRGLVVTSLTGQNFELLAPEAYLASWLPDGDQIAFATLPPENPRSQELIIYIKNFRTNTTQEVKRIDKSARILSWGNSNYSFYTNRYNWSKHVYELLHFDLQSNSDPIVLDSFKDDEIVDISSGGEYVLLERRITPLESTNHVSQLIKYDLNTKAETILVEAWDFILGRLVDDDRAVLVSHPTASLDTPLTSFRDWEVRHRLLDISQGIYVELPNLPGASNTLFHMDVYIRE